MNLILLTIDCLRADHLGCLGYSKKITPNLDYLAGSGVLFSQAISAASWTLPSFTCLFSSSYPSMHGEQPGIANSRVTIAQVLQRYGYRTAAFHSNPFLSSFFGFGKGFDTFDDSMHKNSYESLLRKPRELLKSIVGTKARWLYKFLAYLYGLVVTPSPKADKLNNKAARWLRDNRNDFFLWMHYMDAHEPYWQCKGILSPFRVCQIHNFNLNRKAEKNKYKGSEQGSLSPKEINRLIKLYDENISHVDKMIGSFLRMLDRNNMLSETIVIVTADHGQQFMEHGYYGHRYFLYEELIRVPLIIAGPMLESQVINQQVTLLDLAPTVLDLLGIDKPSSFSGTSLLPLMRGNSTSSKGTDVISVTSVNDIAIQKRRWLNANDKQMSIRTGKWKYIYVEGKQDELYCLEGDPKELQNLIDVEPQIASELRTKIMNHIEVEHATIPSKEEIIKEKVRWLKSSGKI